MTVPATAHADPFEVSTTDGGPEIHLLRTDKYKTLTLAWVLECPLDGSRGARALVTDLLTRGTASYPDLSQLAARCEELYAAEISSSASASGDRQLLRFGLEVVSDRFTSEPILDVAVGLLEESLHRPPLEDGRFRADHFAQERTNLVNAIEGLADDKGLYAYRRLMEVMHAGRPYALHPWGTADEARALTEEIVRGAWSDAIGLAPARLFIVGDVDLEAAQKMAERLGAGRTRAAPSRKRPVQVAEPRETQRVRETEPLSQSKLVMGYRMPEPWLSTAAATLFGVVFGGGAHSRLFKRVREAEGLAYSCGSSVLVDSGTLTVQAGVDGKVAGRVEELVGEELSRLAEDGLPEDELEISRRAQLRRLENLGDDPGSVCGFRLAALLSGRRFVVAEAMDTVRAVTRDDIVAVAGAVSLDSVFLLEGRGS
jgi:predicted Zn-dependent peptidase